MTIAVGERAPAFKLPGSDGSPRSLGDLTASGPTLLAFFKTGCPTCQLAFPVYGEMERRFRDAAPVVAVSQDAMASTLPWLTDKGFDGIALDDVSNKYAVSAAFDVTTVPTLVLVGGDGSVVATAEGWSREDANAIASALGKLTGRPVEPVSTPADGLPPYKPG